MSDYEKLAAAVLPPIEGSINAFAVSTTASAAQDTGVTGGPHFITFICEVDAYVTFGAAGSSTITNPDAAAVAGGGRTWLIPAKQPSNFIVDIKTRYFKVVGSGAGTMRWYLSSR